MKVLIDYTLPFALAHGGLQTQIEQTKAALERRGAEVEYVRWWDEKQTGDVIQYYGRPSIVYIDFAHAKNVKVIVAELLTGLGSRPALARYVQSIIMYVAQTVLPKMFTLRLGWESYKSADGFMANTTWEAHLMHTMFGTDPKKIAVVPNGVEDVFFLKKGESKKTRSDYLVCTATIHPRKRILELAEAAVKAKIPVWVIGKPYSLTDPYYLQFLEAQKKHPDLIRYEGPIHDRAQLADIYHKARGFVLLSTMETHSLSAFEAAAAECPLLLSDLPWAKSVFGTNARYASTHLGCGQLAEVLRRFSAEAPSITNGIIPPKWDDIADQLLAFYRRC
jgi:glycosyltransferase involved in cell wall biosynthesis